VFRFKTIFGDRISARDFSRQKTEILVKCSALNRMFDLGLPKSVVVA